MSTGYLHPSYAEALSEFGSPRQLPGCQGWVLQRQILGADQRDAIGCYPLFSCADWSKLNADLEQIRDGLVCLAVVTDPFGEYDDAYLRECFPDLVLPFKQHFVVDLSRPLDSFVHPHHRRNARKALGQFSVERCARPADFLDDWVDLYQTLIERHQITGMAAFSRNSFSGQFKVPGIVVFRAVHNNKTAGMLLWYVQGNRAYYHLGAYSLAGYDLRASFALFSYSIEYFAGLGTQWLNLGGGAGIRNDATDGLSRFKRGWSNETRMAYLCGRIFDRARYEQIAAAKGIQATDYFPAYRQGEFV